MESGFWFFFPSILFKLELLTCLSNIGATNDGMFKIGPTEYLVLCTGVFIPPLPRGSRGSVLGMWCSWGCSPSLFAPRRSCCDASQESQASGWEGARARQWGKVGLEHQGRGFAEHGQTTLGRCLRMLSVQKKGG